MSSFFHRMESKPAAVTGTAPFFQAKLTVNQPGDAHEREADQVADRVMRMQDEEEPVAQRMTLTPVGGVQRMCAECEEKEKEKVQRAETGSGKSAGQSAPSIVSQVLSSGSGRPIESGTRQFMESRFGQDFGQVRIHTDARAAESAAAIQAKAYTSGRNIVFGSGEYRPESGEGRRLLAHELAHVGQQISGKIYRKINFQTPVSTERNPVPLVLRNEKLGTTIAKFNGDVLPEKDVQKAGQIILNAIVPASLQIDKDASTSTFTAKVDSSVYTVDVSAAMEIITAPANGVWNGTCPPIPLPTAFSHCKGKKEAIPVEMSGFRNLDATVIQHENEHWADIKSLTISELKPAHDFIAGLKGTGKTEIDARNDWMAKLKDTDQKAVVSFLTKLIAANKKYDTPGTGTHFTKTVLKIDKQCTKISITP